METVIAILIYLGALTSGNSYSKKDIKELEKKYKSEIKEIKKDKSLSDKLTNDYIYTPDIWIVDDSQQQ